MSAPETVAPPQVLSPGREALGQLLQNKGAVLGALVIGFFVFLAIFAPFLAPHDPHLVNYQALRLPPAWAAGGQWSWPLGTDDLGRDLLSRLIYGARVSLGAGLAVVALALSSGALIGLVAGFYGGWVDRMLMRFIDIIMALPSILLAIVVMAILGPGLGNAIIAVSIVAVPSFARITRASAMAERNRQYVLASRTFGASSLRIMFVEVLPNCMAPLIVQAGLGISDGILNVAALGFLGLGARPPLPEWGIMLSDARAYIESSPWMVTLPGLCILLVVLGLNILGDGLRDALDPRLKR